MLLVSVILHLLPAIAYLVAGVISNNKQDQHLIIIWYTVGLLELLSIIAHATLSKTLSFEGTHFNERLNLLTLIVLGEGRFYHPGLDTNSQTTSNLTQALFF